MAKKSNKKIVDLAFYQYLNLFYRQNKKKIRTHYKQLTKKFLDFNDPDNSDAFLRKPQFEALEIYIFLKEYLDNKHLGLVFKEWYEKKNKFEGRDERGIGTDGELSLFEEIDSDVFKNAFKTFAEFQQSYPNYIFALTMGIGKTILIATCIFYEFLLSNKFPKDKKYCHNVLVFAPDKTVLQSLKEIQTFNKSKVIPPEYINWLDTHLQFHYLDDTGISLNVIDQSDFNIIISNTQKIILKKQHKEKTSIDKLFTDKDKIAEIKKVNEEFSDLYKFDPDDEKELLTNQRFLKLTRLNQLGIYVDEAHHAFGNTLAKDFGLKQSKTSLRITINELANTLKEYNTHVVGCYNYTGTPYVANHLLPEVVYAYGLHEAISKEYLKQVKIHGYSNSKSKEFIKIAITDFWEEHKNNKYEEMLPKIAFFTSTIEEMEKELRPAVEDILSKLNISHERILVNVGDPKLTTNDDIREFINLDTPTSEKQFILLVNKGKEGWNCRSLFAVGLHRKPKSKVFVLQATMRCLRSIGNKQEIANVYLSDENMSILESELQENFRMSVNDINQAGTDKKTVEVRLVPPPVTLKIKRIQKLCRIEEKKNVASIDLELDKAPLDKYKIIHSTKDIRRLHEKSKFTEILSFIEDQQTYSSIMIIAEISRYLNINPVKIEKILSSTKEGILKILEFVNKYNELLYDWIIPKLFKALFKLINFKSEDEQDINLANPPHNDTDHYTFKVKSDLLANINEKQYKDVKKKSFHLDNYCFGSHPEISFFKTLLNDSAYQKIYYTGMFTHGQSDFTINYIDPESHTLRHYYPDFLAQKRDNSYTIMEVKADYMVDDAVVQAKADYAKQMAVTNGMEYIMIPGSDAEKGMPINEILKKEPVVQPVLEKTIQFVKDYKDRMFKDLLPVYSIEAACGKFGQGQEAECDGWAEVSDLKLNERMFIIKAIGKSMEPKIPENSHCIFRANPVGSRENKIVLVQSLGLTDPDMGEYTIKRYHSSKIKNKDGKWRHSKIILEPLNHECPSMEFFEDTLPDDFKVVAEFLGIYK